MNDLVVITGQTATGKTKLAIDCALRLNGELINADSRQVYKHLDIVTGKDTDVLKKSGIKVHLLDVVNPDQAFSSYDYVILAQSIVKDIWKRKKTPILVGGSYLYIKHLLYGQDIKIPPDHKLRGALEKLSLDKLQKKLLSLDKSLQAKINHSDWSNPRRLIRKIEILKSKHTVGTVYAKPGVDIAYPDGALQIIGLRHKNKEALINAITKRVEKRVAQGALQEVKQLLKMGYKKTDEGLQTIGYKQLISHLEGLTTLEQARHDWINKEIQYAKRQLTFMKLDKNVAWQEV